VAKELNTKLAVFPVDLISQLQPADFSANKPIIAVQSSYLESFVNKVPPPQKRN
jgi:hypothetical protein